MAFHSSEFKFKEDMDPTDAVLLFFCNKHPSNACVLPLWQSCKLAPTNNRNESRIEEKQQVDLLLPLALRKKLFKQA